MLIETPATPANDLDLQKSIELKCSECYGAMSIANAIGGTPSRDWHIARKFKLADLIAEAGRRGLDMSGWKTAVDHGTLCDSKAFIEAAQKIHRIHHQGAKLTAEGWYCDDGTVFLGTTVEAAAEAIFA